MRYLKVIWEHDLPNEPVALFSELDDANRELRKVEVFADGHYGFADMEGSIASTVLAETPLPSFDEIASDSQFRPEWIARPDFERIWRTARRLATGAPR
jgi:hypothetical protein